MNTDDFMRGQQDCMDGKPHKAGQSESYDRGYAAQLQREEDLKWFREVAMA